MVIPKAVLVFEDCIQNASLIANLVFEKSSIDHLAKTFQHKDPS